MEDNSSNQQISFNDMPNALAYIIGKIDNIETMLSAEKTIDNDKDRWMNIDDLREYHPDHPAKPTIYSWISQRIIPYHKRGKRLQFLKSEIDAWLRETRHKTLDELNAEALSYENKKGKRR